MNTYKYRILTKGSAVVEGKRAAESKAKLIDYLKQSGYIVLKVQEAEVAKGSKLFANYSAKKSTVMFTQELSTLLESGVSIDRSLKILSEAQENKHFSGIVADLLEGIKGGKSLAESITAFPDIFPNIYVSMVRAGEESGVLPQVLNRLGSFMEKAQRIKSEITSALIYPVFLVLSGVSSIAALVLLVIPRFSSVFDDMGIALPLSTQLLINLSGVIISYGWISILFLPGAFYLYKWYLKQDDLRMRVDEKKLRIPILGNVLWRVEISRFSRTLGTLLENGVSLLNALDITRGVLGNSFLTGIIEKSKPEIKAGKGLLKPLGERSFFPLITFHLLSIGEETGTLDEMLIRVADGLDTDVEDRIKRLISLIEPILILVMGVGLGAVVISMLSAIFSINEVSF